MSATSARWTGAAGKGDWHDANLGGYGQRVYSSGKVGHVLAQSRCWTGTYDGLIVGHYDTEDEARAAVDAVGAPW